MTTKQKIKEEKKLKGEVIPLLKYEGTRLLRKAIVPVIVACIVSFLLCNILGRVSLLVLSSIMLQIVQVGALSTTTSTFGSVFSASSGINNLLTMIVVTIVFTAMLFTSILREEDIYPLLRVDRNKLLLIRSFLNVAFYTIISVLIIYFTKQYIISSDIWGRCFPPS